MSSMSWFAKRRFLVTGGAGFLGGVLVPLLRERGAAHVGVVRRSEHDLRDPRACRAAIEEHAPDVVVHLAAAVGGIGANRDNPGTFFHDNMAMGLHLVEACRAANVEKIVVAGTVCAYPKHVSVPFSEDDLWNGYPEETNAPYGVAKRALAVMLDAYHRQHGLASAFLVPANLYGPRDDIDLHSSHVIPALIRKMVDAREAGDASVTLWGDGSPSREFLHVSDCAEGLALACERLDEPVPVNLGTGRETAIRALAETIRDIVGFEGTIEWDTSKPNGQPRRCLDISRARRLLGFEPRITLEDGLAETVRWYEDERRAAGGPPQ